MNAAAQPRFAFIMALGRSGTQFLSQLLDSCPDVVFRHEPVAADRHLLSLAHAGVFDTVLDDLLRARFQSVTAQLPPSTRVYGESNSYLRYFSAWLRDHLDARLVHVHRDGRSFVRSAYTRVTYTPYDGASPIVPRNDDPASREWATWTRFERLCWYWNHTNRFLLDQTRSHAQIELATTDYSYFRTMILAPLELELPEARWRHAAARPRNTRRGELLRARLRHAFRRSGFRPPPDIGPWERWPSAWCERFWDLCGDTMDALGYHR